MTSIRTLVVITICLLTTSVWSDNRKEEQEREIQAVQAWEVGNWWIVYRYVSDPIHNGEKDTWRINGSNLIHVVGKEVIGTVDCFKVNIYSSSKKEPQTFYYRCDNLGIIIPELMPATKYAAEYHSSEQIQIGIPPIVNSTIAQTLQKREEKIGDETFVYIEYPNDKDRLFVKSPFVEKANKYYEYSAGAKFYNITLTVEDNNRLGEICITQKHSNSKSPKLEDAIAEWQKDERAERAIIYTTGELTKKYDLSAILKVANINVPDENKGHGNDADRHDEDNPGKGDDKKHDNDKDDNDADKGLDKNKKESEPAKENKK